jgi:hypothetical protein
MTTDKLDKIAATLNGSLIAYRRITALADDERYAIAYSFGGGAWAVAIVDADSGDYIDGTSLRDPITPGNVALALERTQRDATS